MSAQGRFPGRMFRRQLHARRALPAAPAPAPASAPPPRECASYAALSRNIARATGCAAAGPVDEDKAGGAAGAGMSTMALAERVMRGEEVPYAALTHRVVPNVRHHVVDTYKARVYGGRFVGPSGSRFVTSCQDRHIRVYDTGGCEKRVAWRLTHVIRCEDVRWTVTDFDVSPCGRWLAYATINQFLHVVDLDRPARQRELDLSAAHAYGGYGGYGGFGVMSLCWSHDGKEIIVGTTGSFRAREGYVVAYNVDVEQGIDSVSAHGEDVNSVCFLKEGERNMLLSGSDDGLGKMWDRREIRGQGKDGVARPCGAFIGHCEGLTHMSTKNDGRFLISQGKDQCIKLWDVRKTASISAIDKVGMPPKDRRWDYRYEQYPGPSAAARCYRDDSVMTYSGAHETLQTLIRSYFSPMHTTGQKYIYTGSNNGSCTIYDVLTGKVVASLTGHQAVTRDVSWHPLGPFLTTVSWDHRVILWSTHREGVDFKPKNTCVLRGFAQRCEKFSSWLG